MTKENKAGLAAAGAFLALVGTVVALKTGKLDADAAPVADEPAAVAEKTVKETKKPAEVKREEPAKPALVLTGGTPASVGGGTPPPPGNFPLASEDSGGIKTLAPTEKEKMPIRAEGTKGNVLPPPSGTHDDDVPPSYAPKNKDKSRDVTGFKSVTTADHRDDPVPARGELLRTGATDPVPPSIVPPPPATDKPVTPPAATDKPVPPLPPVTDKPLTPPPATDKPLTSPSATDKPVTPPAPAMTDKPLTPPPAMDKPASVGEVKPPEAIAPPPPSTTTPPVPGAIVPPFTTPTPPPVGVDKGPAPVPAPVNEKPPVVSPPTPPGPETVKPLTPPETTTPLTPPGNGTSAPPPANVAPPPTMPPASVTPPPPSVTDVAPPMVPPVGDKPLPPVVVPPPTPNDVGTPLPRIDNVAPPAPPPVADMPKINKPAAPPLTASSAPSANDTPAHSTFVAERVPVAINESAKGGTLISAGHNVPLPSSNADVQWKKNADPKAGALAENKPLPKTEAVMVGGSGYRPPARQVAKTQRYDVMIYPVAQGDSWELVSFKHYNSEGCAAALRAFNMQHGQSSSRMQREGTLKPSETAIIPPFSVLKERYGSLLPKEDDKPVAPPKELSPAVSGNGSPAVSVPPAGGLKQ